MTEAEFKEIKTTMPWSERVIATGRGGLVQIIDCQGREVPLFTIVKFLAMITQKLARPATEKDDKDAQQATTN